MPDVARSRLSVGLERALREAGDLAEHLIRARGPLERLGLQLLSSMKSLIAAFNIATLVWQPRRSYRCVSSPNQRSTWFSHDALPHAHQADPQRVADRGLSPWAVGRIACPQP
jgi:hypothetical protein